MKIFQQLTFLMINDKLNIVIFKQQVNIKLVAFIFRVNYE